MDPAAGEYESSTALYTDPEEHWDMNPGTDYSWPNDTTNTWWDDHTDQYDNYDQQPYYDERYNDHTYEEYDVSYNEEE